MHDEIASAVGSDMDDVALNRDAAEPHAAIVAHDLVVVAGYEHEARALAGLAQELLQHIIVGLRPVDAAPDAPEIDDVADEVDARGVVAAQELEEGFGLAGLGAEMQVRDEKRAVTLHARFGLHRGVSPRFQHDGRGRKLLLLQACDKAACGR